MSAALIAERYARATSAAIEDDRALEAVLADIELNPALVALKGNQPIIALLLAARDAPPPSVSAQGHAEPGAERSPPDGQQEPRQLQEELGGLSQPTSPPAWMSSRSSART